MMKGAQCDLCVALCVTWDEGDCVIFSVSLLANL